MGAVILAALYLSQANVPGKLVGVALGVAAWYFITEMVQNYLFSRNWEILKWIRSGIWVPGDRTGYGDIVKNAWGFPVLDAKGRPMIKGLYERQTFAFYQFGLSFIFFLLGSFKHILREGEKPLVPTLSLVLLLMMLLCWGFSLLAFFLDRYRVPVISVIILVATLAGLSRQSDFYYEGTPRTATPITKSVLGSDLLRTTEPTILVATTGGGIQAAGWTARVLMGLSRESGFSQHVRVVSSVSGGSVGAMFFLATYQQGQVPTEQVDLDHDPTVVAAQTSSLDQITWGLAYPDFLFSIIPFVKGVGWDSSGRLHLADGGSIFFDRGLMLEKSWLHHRSDPQHDPLLKSDPMLMEWRQDVAGAVRPAIIFNSTLVETGQRFLLATTDFDRGVIGDHTGRVEFMSQYPDLDLHVRTAARLSATFPYVSPAARLLRNDIDPNQERDQHEHQHKMQGNFHDHSVPHAVDGGYYDNYGMTSLLDWLYAAFQVLGKDTPKPAPLPPVLVVQIRSSPTQADTTDLQTSFGFWFQLLHPIETLWNVRGTGQLSHNELDGKLVDGLYSNVCSAIFEFSETNNNGCPRTEPLNWHLTPDDIAALRDAWDPAKQPKIQQGIDQVKLFLKTGDCAQVRALQAH